MAERRNIVEEINKGDLFLRKVTKDDADFVFESLNDKIITTYLSLGPMKTIEHSKRLIKGYLKYWDNHLQFNYIIEVHGPQKNDKERIGSISLWNINWQHYRSQIGIWIIHSYWGKGFGEKALNLIKIIAFNYLKLNRLEAYIAKENERSINLFEKCNFLKEGILHQYLKFKGTYYDALLMSCLKNKF
ncbi:MAG: GNAT family N-acetyltransferase [Promethearchaeota archaeon]|nr:MAG: GNAT family N-acetyltransferase [Candidatus Lokiarchaeota archaeon]